MDESARVGRTFGTRHGGYVLWADPEATVGLL
jgi:hypothetical protein